MRGRKLNISLFLLHNLIFVVPKNIRIISAHYFIMKTPNNRELQQIAFNYSSDIDFRDFMNFYKKCTAFYIFSLRNSFRKTKQKKKNQEKKQIKTIKDQREKQIKALKNKVEKIF